MLKTRAGKVIGTQLAGDSAEAPARLIRRREVQRLTGLPTSTIYWLMQNKRFPRPVPLGAKAVAWVECEVQAWVADCIAARDQTKAA